MASRRLADRRDDRDSDDHSARKLPHKEPTRSNKAPLLGEFWLDGADIDRQVLQASICRFLGPEATCRPFEHQGTPGYKIRAVRPFTPSMLEDLKARSREFAQEVTAKRGQNEPRYEESQTRLRADAQEDMDYEPSPISNPRNQYTSLPSSTPGSSAQYSPEFVVPYPTSIYPSGANVYTTQTPYTGHSGFATGSYNDPRNGYAQDYYPGSRDGPQPGPSYGGGFGMPGPGYADPSRRTDNMPSYGYGSGVPPPRVFNPPYDYDSPHGGHGNPQNYPQPPTGGQAGQPSYGQQREAYGRQAPTDQYSSHTSQRRR